MTLHYEYEAEKETLTVRPRGVLKPSDIREYFEEVSTNPDVGVVKVEIVDFEAVTDFGFFYSDLNKIRRVYEKTLPGHKGTQITIFLAPEDLQFGIARMTASAFGDKLPMVAARFVEDVDAKLKAAGIWNLR